MGPYKVHVIKIEYVKTLSSISLFLPKCTILKSFLSNFIFNLTHAANHDITHIHSRRRPPSLPRSLNLRKSPTHNNLVVSHLHLWPPLTTPSQLESLTTSHCQCYLSFSPLKCTTRDNINRRCYCLAGIKDRPSNKCYHNHYYVCW